MTQSLPEIGQLVSVRSRQWVVTGLAESALRDGVSASSQHLLHLASIDDDSIDETLSVVWQLEPGARILDVAGLPKVDGIDDAESVSTFLDAVRWGAATNADHALLQSPFRSGISIQDHQLDPLVRAIDMSRTSLLIADDVGLGKTIEAGLVVQELIIRHRARTALVVCPASLQVKWKLEMQEKFGLEFRIVNTDYIRRLRRERGLHANPWTSFPRLIASMDWMKRGEGLRLVKDALPAHPSYPRKFDILVVDEAHNVAPSGGTHYMMPSQRTELIRTIAPHFQHRLFLTATPHNGYQESFTALLELLDDQRFARTVMPDEDTLRRVMVRRLKTDLVDAEGNRIYPVRRIEGLPVPYTEEEREAHQLLRDYAQSRMDTLRGTRGSSGTEFVLKLLKKRLFSSPMAFANTLAKHRDTLKKGKKKKDTALDERILRKAIQKCREDYSDDAALESAQDEAVEAATEMSTALTTEERSLLDRLSHWAEVHKNRADSKAKAIVAWLREHLETDGAPNGKRVILFTEYRATHAWMKQILVAEGWRGERISTLHGGTDPDDRELIKAAFQASPKDSKVQILLATDAASEGIDLQNHCNYLIHIEIPWNPNVMEQRNGRIDRHGQREDEVVIWHPVGAGTDIHKPGVGQRAGDLHGDHEFLLRAVQKVDQMREDLGCVGPVIAKQIEEAMLGKRQHLDTRPAEAKAATTRKFVAAERQLKERIGKLHKRLVNAREEQRIEPRRVHRAVSLALKLAGKPPLETVAMPADFEGEAYRVPMLTGSWGQAVVGLEHPHTGVRRPITFDHDAASRRDDVVLAHLQHKLVQMSLRLLRAEVWAPEERRKIHRVAVRSIPDAVAENPVIVVWSRLVLTGSGHHRLHEELTMAGGEFKPKGFSRIETLEGIIQRLNASAPAQASKRTIRVLDTQFEERRDGVIRAVEARSKRRLQTLTNTLRIRCEAEEKDLNGVLDDLKALIERELADPEPKGNYELFPSEEKKQLERDATALRARLARLPRERKEELAAIRSRYAEPKHRTFPVAIEFLVPESMLEGGE